MDMTNQPKEHVVVNREVFIQAMVEFVDSQYKQMIYNRNIYKIDISYAHYLKAIAGLQELESATGEPHQNFNHLHSISLSALNLEKFGFTEEYTRAHRHPIIPAA